MIKFQKLKECEEIDNKKWMTVWWSVGYAVGIRVRLPFKMHAHIYSPRTRTTWFGKHVLDMYIAFPYKPGFKRITGEIGAREYCDNPSLKGSRKCDDGTIIRKYDVVS